MNTRARLIAFAVAAVTIAAPGGCTRGDNGVARHALRPVVLPDLSNASASVGGQLREAYASLTRTATDRHAAAGEIGAAYGRMGMLLMAAEFRDEAEASLLNAQALAPEDRRWPYYLGHLYKARGDAPKSAAAFEQALKLQPADVTTLVWVGEAYLDQGRAEAAEPFFNSVLSQQPGSVPALFGLGRAALAKRQYAAAARYLEQALSYDRETAQVIHYPLAMAYRELGEAEKAEAHMRQRGPGEIRPADPLMQELEALLESAVAYEVRGAKALDQGDWATAAANFRKGLELAPNEPSLHHKLGTALYLNGDARAAIEQFEEALRLSPSFAKAHYSLGVLLGSSGHPDQAIEHLSAAVRHDPAYVEARLRLADVLRTSGRVRESLSQYDEVAKLDARVADAPIGYALALVALKRYPEARDRLIAGMKAYPDNPAFAHALVRLLAAAPDDRVRDGQAALNIMRQLLAKEPRSGEIAEMMAMTLAELGQFGEAVAWQRQAIAAAEREGRRDLIEQLSAALSLYEYRKPFRISR